MRYLYYSYMDVSYLKTKSATELSFLVIGPGSFLEVAKVLPLWTEAGSEQPNFHVVAISLPGYGFSQAPSKRGFQMAQYAEVRML
jgi:pimeloyl-ACP methyl ester carboxylesterase